MRVTFASDNTAEGSVSPAWFDFNATNWNVPFLANVIGVNDFLIDGNVAYTIVVGVDQAATAATEYDIIDPADVAVTNNDDDAAGFVVTPVQGLQTSESGATAAFTVRLASQPTADVTLALNSDTPGEGTIDKSSLIFTAADWNVNQTVTITGVDDGAGTTTNDTYNIVTGSAVSSDGSYSGLDPSDVAVTNKDNETSQIVINPLYPVADRGVTTESGGWVEFRIVLSRNVAPGTKAELPLATSDSTEGQFRVDGGGLTTSATLTFGSGGHAWNDDFVIRVEGQDDTDTADQLYQININDVIGDAGSGYFNQSVPEVYFVNRDNDGAPPLRPRKQS